MTRRPRRGLLWTGGIVLGAFLLVQAVPYGRAHDNPRPTREARIADPAAATLFKDACADCHTDHTVWPAYSNVAPVSWLVQHDVEDGRAAFNLSEWTGSRRQPSLGEVRAKIAGGDMPPLQYRLIHSAGRLSASDKRRLVQAMVALFAKDPPRSSSAARSR